MSMSFIIACESGKRKIAELLLANQEVEVGYTDEKGRTALHYAAHHGYLDLVQILIDRGAALDYEDHAGETPFYFACLQKQKQTALFLLDKGARIDLKDCLLYTSDAARRAI